MRTYGDGPPPGAAWSSACGGSWNGVRSTAALRASGRMLRSSGRAAESELLGLPLAGFSGAAFSPAVEAASAAAAAVLRHNTVVFRGGEGAPRELPALLGRLPEARLNLAIHHLRAGRVEEAHTLLTSGAAPTLAHECLVQAVCRFDPRR